MELPLPLVNESLLSESRCGALLRCQSQKPQNQFPEEIVGRVIKCLERKGVAAWISTCKDAFRAVGIQSHSVTHVAGIQISAIFAEDEEVQSRFSPWLLARALVLSSKSEELNRPLFAFGPLNNFEIRKVVSEQRSKGILTKVILTLSENSSRSYWLQRIHQLTSLPSYPTALQAQELTIAIKTFITEKNGAPETIVEAILENKAAQNKIQKCVIVVELLKARKSSIGAERLVAGAEAAKFIYALYSGLTVDELKDNAYDIKKWKSPPVLLRKAIIKILKNASSWRMLLAPMLTDAGLWKYIAKSCHLYSFCKDKSTGRIALALHFLRGGLAKPAEERDLQDLDRRGIRDALLSLAKDPNYDYSQDNTPGELFISEFLRPGPEKLILHPPLRANLASLLAQRGNTAETWRRATELQIISAQDYLLNIRSMVFMDLPETDNMVQSLLALPVDKVSLAELLKIRKLLIGEFLVPGAAAIGAVRRARLDADATGEARLELDTGALYKDKRGQLYEVRPVHRSVGPAFSEATAKRYLAGIDTVLADRLGRIDFGKNVTVSCCCIDSHELWTNGPRRGIPPSIPKYSLTSSWRNETVDLTSVAAAAAIQEETGKDAMDVEGALTSKLLFGISWCEAKGSTGSVDLDASVMLYDANFQYLDCCSYQNLSIGHDAIRHSGDLVQAPYPDGARETVEIDIVLLKAQKPDARYLVLVIHAFSGQSLDTLEDASAFVADPSRQGQGPGSTYVLCAARLTGKGTMNIASYLDLGGGELDCPLAFSTIDHTCNVKNHNATSSTGMISTHLRRLVAMAESPSRLRLADVSCFYAHAILQNGSLRYIGKEPLEPTTVEASAEPAISRFGCDHVKLCASLPMFQPTRLDSSLFPTETSQESKAALVVFGGDLDNWLDLLREAPEDWVTDPDRRRIIFVNLRSDRKELTIKRLKVAGIYRSLALVSGWDILPLIIEHLQEFSMAMHD